MRLLDKLLHRDTTDARDGDGLRSAIDHYLDPLDPDKGTYGDMPDGAPGKPPGEGGSTPTSELS